MKYILIAFAFAFGVMNALGQSNLIPAPAEYSVRSGSISSKEMAGLHEKVRISPKALLRLLKDRKLEDWQLKSAYQLELRKKGVKIVAADEEGVFYARQTLKMMAALDSSVAYCTILDWPRFPYRGVMLD
jgi:hexosaminidase